jgi:enoyl-CoA hydratase/carnithine racemase
VGARRRGVGTLTINRPEQFNGMTTQMLREAHELLHEWPTTTR